MADIGKIRRHNSDLASKTQAMYWAVTDVV